MGGQLLQQIPPAEAVDGATWPEVLRCVGLLLPHLHDERKCSDALAALGLVEYEALGVAEKMALLRGLCDVFLGAYSVGQLLKEREAKQ